MASEFNDERDEIKFLYKFVKGQADKSHGIMMAKAAGLPGVVISKAHEKALEIAQEKDKMSEQRHIEDRFNSLIKVVSGINQEQDSTYADTIFNQLSFV